MIYLVIMVVVAACGIARLMLQQRRERSHLETVDGFRESLRTLSRHAHVPPGAYRRPRVGPSSPSLLPLDPKRRAAARRRIEARRGAPAARVRI